MNTLFRTVGLLPAVSAFAAASCGPPDFQGVPEAFEARPLANVVGQFGSRNVDWVLRVTSDQHHIVELAVTDQHLYFSARWDGLYRTSKSGGAIEVVEADRDTLFEPLARAGQEVYWQSSTFDKDDFPSIRIRNQTARQSRRSLFEGALTTMGSNAADHFQTDATGLYLTASQRYPHEKWAVQRIPPGGGSPVPLLAIADVGQAPTWVVDRGELFFTACPDSRSACELMKRSQDGTVSRLAYLSSQDLPSQDLVVRAADAEAVYLSDAHTVGRVPRGGGPLQTLYSTSGWISWAVAADGTHVYFVETEREGNRSVYLRAVPKDGSGGAVVVGDLSAHRRAATQMVVDDAIVYLLISGGTEILAVPKHPPPR
jgi:hypothetical protein